jgi:hypothetical protein
MTLRDEGAVRTKGRSRSSQVDSWNLGWGGKCPAKDMMPLIFILDDKMSMTWNVAQYSTGD